MGRTVTEKSIRDFKVWLEGSQVNETTAEKYIAGIGKLAEYLGGKEVTQETLDGFKIWLVDEKKHKKRSTNSYIMSVRSFCRAMKWSDLSITAYPLEPTVHNSGEKYITRGDYQRLVTATMEVGNYRLAMLVQTLCHMDIRYSEMEQVSVDAVEAGIVEVSRRQNRIQLGMPGYLQESLQGYLGQAGVTSGVVFQTSGGKMLNRSNAWREIRQLCEAAGIEKGRVTLQKLKMPRMHDYYPFYPMPESRK